MKVRDFTMSTSYLILIIFLIITFSACEQEEPEIISLGYQMFEQIYEHPECETDEGPCVTLIFTYPEFTGEEPLVSNLNGWVSNQLFEEEKGINSENFEQLARQWYSDYEIYSTEIDDYNISWSLERRVELVHDNPDLISLHFHEFSFTGGAHPIQTDIFRSFQKPEGRIITLDDLTYDQSQFQLLTSLAEEQFRYTFELLEEENLEDAGFWFVDNDFHLTDNFSFTNFGLLFYYNVYEVAPYATGPIAVEIEYRDLQNILRSIWLHDYEQLSLK
jgi:hypothetical protein